MALFFLPAYSGGCCPVCPPPGSCDCPGDIVDCDDCIVDDNEIVLDGNCDPVQAPGGGNIQVIYPPCPADTPDYTNFEANHPQGAGWTVIEGCNACNTCDNDTVEFFSDTLNAGEQGTYFVDFVALTTWGATIRFELNDCECPNVETPQTILITSVGGTTQGNNATVVHQIGSLTCGFSARVLCESIPGDCCGWKLAWRKDVVAAPGCCANPQYDDFVNEVNAALVGGETATFLTGTQISDLLLGNTVSVGGVACGESGTARLLVATTSDDVPLRLELEAPNVSCGGCSLNSNSIPVTAECDDGLVASGNVNFSVPEGSDWLGGASAEFLITMTDVEDYLTQCCGFAVALVTEVLFTDEICDITPLVTTYCVDDNGSGKQQYTIETLIEPHCCIPQNSPVVSGVSCSDGSLNCSDYTVTVVGNKIHITKNVGTDLETGTLDIFYDAIVPVSAASNCECGLSSDFDLYPFSSNQVTAELDPNECCFTQTEIDNFESFVFEYDEASCNDNNCLTAYEADQLLTIVEGPAP